MGKIDSKIGSSLISGAAGVLGTIGSIYNTKQSIKAQQQENERTRQYNLALARMQNQWNLEQWNRENAYNSPTEMMARYRAAGLNGNLLYGQQNPSASSPVMTAGEPGYSADMSNLASMPTVGTAISESLNNSLLAAQIDKLRSETKGQNETNKILATEAEVRELTKGNAIKLSNIEVQNNIRLGNLTSYQNDIALKTLDQLGKNIEVMNSQISEMEARTANIDEDTVIKKLQQPFIQNQLDMIVKGLAKDLDIKEAEAKQILTMLPLMVAKMNADTKLTNEETYLTVSNRIFRDTQTVGEKERNIQDVFKTRGFQLTNRGIELDNTRKEKENSWINFNNSMNAVNSVMDAGIKFTKLWFSW